MNKCINNFNHQTMKTHDQIAYNSLIGRNIFHYIQFRGKRMKLTSKDNSKI
jgi:hypothetical protein